MPSESSKQADQLTLFACPGCGQEREMTPGAMYKVEAGWLTGFCRPCGVSVGRSENPLGERMAAIRISKEVRGWAENLLASGELTQGDLRAISLAFA